MYQDELSQKEHEQPKITGVILSLHNKEMKKMLNLLSPTMKKGQSTLSQQ